MYLFVTRRNPSGLNNMEMGLPDCFGLLNVLPSQPGEAVVTIKRFQEEPYLTQLKATVEGVFAGENPCFSVDQTIFYAQGGGQPGDVGTVISASGRVMEIVDTRYADDRKTILHFLKSAEGVEELNLGDSVSLKINWSRRYRLMRMHTAMHLLCSIIPFPVTGGGVGESESRVEFDMQTTDFDKTELSHKLNAMTENGIRVDTSWITDEELDANPDLVRTMSVKPPRGTGQIRMIKVGDNIDYQPCGGTHVRNTSEIGPLQVTKIKSKGKQNKRVSITLLEP